MISNKQYCETNNMRTEPIVTRIRISCDYISVYIFSIIALINHQESIISSVTSNI